MALLSPSVRIKESGGGGRINPFHLILLLPALGTAARGVLIWFALIPGQLGNPVCDGSCFDFSPSVTGEHPLGELISGERGR